jgi:predicted aconitase
MPDLSNDLVMVHRITLAEIPAWYLVQFGVPHRTAPEVRFAELISEMVETDELWVSHSREIGTLHGHEGLALVRDGKPIKYEIIIDH